MSFKDHFSGHSQSYARYRPQYPRELFDYLASLTSSHDIAIDCACGSGQASGALAARFKFVYASDASIAQLVHAERYERVCYVACTAERHALRDRAADLFAVAQAAHWFDFERFYPEVQRVVKPGGIAALWSYGLATIDADVDAVVQHLYGGVLAEYWPAERRYVDAGYKTLPFPFAELSAPDFSIRLEWTLDELIGYLETWSALQRYRKQTGKDPLPAVRTQLRNCWNLPDSPRSVNWPIYLRVGRV